MATIQFLDPIAANLSTSELAASPRTVLNVTSNNAPWICCNFPELIGELVNGTRTGMALAGTGYGSTYGYYINRQSFSGAAQIFFSHWNKTGATLKYRIRLTNTSSATATVVRSSVGFSKGWADPNATIRNFFSSTSQTWSVAAGSSIWITDEYSASSEEPFNGMLRLNSTQTVQVTVYAYKNASDVTGNEVVYPYANGYRKEVYSGRGTGYFMTFNHGTITTSSMPYRYTVNANHSALRNTNEIVPITLVGTNIVASVTNPDPDLSNLGNWCVQNLHNITLHNNSTAQKVVYGYLGANVNGNAHTINRGGVVKSCLLTNESGKRTWKWCSVTLAAGESTTFDYQQIASSYYSPSSVMEWRLT